MKYAIGIMSGTSLDALDVALIEFTPQFLTVRVIAFASLKFEDAFKQKLSRSRLYFESQVKEICEINIELSQLAHQGILQVLKAAQKKPQDIECIGYHGLTLWHDPEKKMTFQIGDGPTLAALTQIPVVNNFRTKDMAYGGQGAPLMPFAHKVLFQKNPQEKLVVHNLGGISNPTYLSESLSLAFDIGPCNLLLDGLMQILFNKPFDDKGVKASLGKSSKLLLNKFLNDAYLLKAPPKSTGPERYSKEYVESWVKEAKQLNLSASDTLASAARFISQSVRITYEKFFGETGIDRVLFCGGGTQNDFLWSCLKQDLPYPIYKTSECGIDEGSVEAAGFALLGYLAIERKTNTLPGLTGSSTPASLGQISYP